MHFGKFICILLFSNMLLSFNFIDSDFDDFSRDYDGTIYCITLHPATNMFIPVALQPGRVVRVTNLF